MPAASSIKIMIVDDHQTMRSLVRNGLHQLGFIDLVEASDGEAALKAMISSVPPKLIISDFNMPKLDGLGLLRSVRAYEPLKTVAFIMLTGQADKDLVQRAVQFGVNNYLVKPFTIATLKGKIEAVFGPIT